MNMLKLMILPLIMSSMISGDRRRQRNKIFMVVFPVQSLNDQLLFYLCFKALLNWTQSPVGRWVYTRVCIILPLLLWRYFWASPSF